MAHDFVNFPELRSNQMDFYYFQSPHKQIFEDIRVKVTKVIDGDTIRARWVQRDFEFPIRVLDVDAPEMNEEKGQEVQSWLEKKIEGEMIDIIIDRFRRVDKWGRLLGHLFHRGTDIGAEMVNLRLVKTWEGRKEGKIPNPSSELSIERWL